MSFHITAAQAEDLRCGFQRVLHRDGFLAFSIEEEPSEVFTSEEFLQQTPLLTGEFLWPDDPLPRIPTHT